MVPMVSGSSPVADGNYGDNTCHCAGRAVSARLMAARRVASCPYTSLLHPTKLFPAVLFAVTV